MNKKWKPKNNEWCWSLCFGTMNDGIRYCELIGIPRYCKMRFNKKNDLPLIKEGLIFKTRKKAEIAYNKIVRMLNDN